MNIKKAATAICVCAGAAALAAGTAIFLVAPEKPAKSKSAPFYGRNFAHRGLHKRDRSIPENSLLAFNKAAEKGYGIELDVRLSADGRVVVFHDDDDLQRCCGVPGCIEIMTWDEISKLRLFGSDESIPLLEDVFNIVDSRVPIIIELKRGPRNKVLCTRTLEAIRMYPGPVCVQSFDPFILRWFRKKSPHLLRGQLTNSSNSLGCDISGVAGSILSRVLLNFVSRPNYIAHGVGKKSVFVRLAEKLGALRFSWTSYSAKTEETCDAVIFEYYEPEPKFK